MSENNDQADGHSNEGGKTFAAWLKSVWRGLGFHVHEWGKWECVGQLVRCRDNSNVGEAMQRNCSTCGDRQVKKLWMVF